MLIERTKNQVIIGLPANVDTEGAATPGGLFELQGGDDNFFPIYEPHISTSSSKSKQD